MHTYFNKHKHICMQYIEETKAKDARAFIDIDKDPLIHWLSRQTVVHTLKPIMRRIRVKMTGVVTDISRQLPLSLNKDETCAAIKKFITTPVPLGPNAPEHHADIVSICNHDTSIALKSIVKICNECGPNNPKIPTIAANIEDDYLGSEHTETLFNRAMENVRRDPDEYWDIEL